MSGSQYENIREPIGRIAGQISRMYLSRLHSRLKQLDIDRSYYTLLLIEAGNGRMIQKDLADLLSVDKVQIVRIIDYLVSNGYVVRGKDPDDKRKWNLRITEKASEHIPRIRKAINETTAVAFKDIPPEQSAYIYNYLKKIESNLASKK